MTAKVMKGASGLFRLRNTTKFVGKLMPRRERGTDPADLIRDQISHLSAAFGDKGCC